MISREQFDANLTGKQILESVESQYPEALRKVREMQLELDQWRTWGIVEIAVRNPQVAEYVEHWEGRALRAEAKLAELAPIIACPLCGTPPTECDKCKELARLLLEARDALPAITLSSARLHGVDLTLADRIEAALEPWHVAHDDPRGI